MAAPGRPLGNGMSHECEEYTDLSGKPHGLYQVFHEYNEPPESDVFRKDFVQDILRSNERKNKASFPGVENTPH